MEIVDKRFVWPFDGNWDAEPNEVCGHSRFIVKHGNQYFLTRVTGPSSILGKPLADLAKLTEWKRNMQPIPYLEAFPKRKSGWTVIDESEAIKKRAHLKYYQPIDDVWEPHELDFHGDGEDLGAKFEGYLTAWRITNEVEAYEAINRTPHESFQAYYGCKVTKDDRVCGIYLSGIPDRMLSLRDKVEDWRNPLKPGKVLQRLGEGLGHLHRLGLAHNDIYPGCIYIDPSGRLYITNLESCTPFETELKGEWREMPTKPFIWPDPGKVDRSYRENDCWGLEKMEEWVKGKWKEEKLWDKFINPWKYY